MVAFCVPRSGQAASEALRSELIDLVSAQLGKPLRPPTIHFVQALPKNPQR